MKTQNLKVTSLILLAAVFFASNAFAGAANTLIECKNAAGRVVLKGDVPGDIAEFTLEARARNEKGELVESKLYSVLNQETVKTEENASLTKFEDRANGVYAFQAESLKKEDGELISLYAIPKTMKVKPLPYGHSMKFKGKLSFGNGNSWIRTNVACTAEYSI